MAQAQNTCQNCWPSTPLLDSFVLLQILDYIEFLPSKQRQTNKDLFHFKLFYCLTLSDCVIWLLEIASRRVRWIDWHSWLLILSVCVRIFSCSFSVRMWCITVQRLGQFLIGHALYKFSLLLLLSFYRGRNCQSRKKNGNLLEQLSHKCKR